MKRILPFALAFAVVCGLGYFAWRWLFPDDQAVIRQRLTRLAALTTVQSKDSALIRLGSANKLVEFFSRDVVFALTDAGYGLNSIQGRDALREIVVAGKANVQQLEVEFPDVVVQVAADRRSASVHCTALVHLNGERNSGVFELIMEFEKPERTWLIRRVESVPLLSQ